MIGVALDAAEKSLVLLKNDGVLPPRVRRAFASRRDRARSATPPARCEANYSAPCRRALPSRCFDGAAPGRCRGASITYAPCGPHFHRWRPDTDDGASHAPDGAPVFLARYYNATTTPPRFFA